MSHKVTGAAKSPWRYPGGKTRLSERILEYLPSTFDGFTEPFVGGGGFTFSALGRITPGTPVELNDADPRVAAWWELMAHGTDKEYERFRERLLGYVPTVKSFFSVRRQALSSGRLSDRAFASIATNRTAYSGVLDAHPIGGKDQKSAYPVGCRYNPEKMASQHDRVREVLADHEVRVVSRDFREFLDLAREQSFLYLDPPYVRPGKMLYSTFFSQDDHQDLADFVLSKREGNWAVSYDDEPWVRERYSEARIIKIPVRYSVSTSNERRVLSTELLVVPE